LDSSSYIFGVGTHAGPGVDKAIIAFAWGLSNECVKYFTGALQGGFGAGAADSSIALFTSGQAPGRLCRTGRACRARAGVRRMIRIKDSGVDTRRGLGVPCRVKGDEGEKDSPYQYSRPLRPGPEMPRNRCERPLTAMQIHSRADGPKAQSHRAVRKPTVIGAGID